MLAHGVFDKMVLAEKTPKAQAALERADARVAELVTPHVGKLGETHEANIALVRAVVTYGLITRLVACCGSRVVHLSYGHSHAFTSGCCHLPLKIHPMQLYTVAVLPENTVLAFAELNARGTHHQHEWASRLV